MKRKEISGLLIALGLLFGCSCFVGCQQTNPEDPSGQQPGGDDGENTGTEQSAKITVFSVEPSAAKIVFMGSAVIGKDAPEDAEVGIELSTSVVFPAATTERKKAVVAEGSSTYTLEFTGLKFDTEYYYRTYNISGGKTVNGTATRVRTTGIAMELVDRNTTQTSVTLHGTVSEIVEEIEYGICYSDSYEKVESDQKQTFTPDAGKNFTVTLDGLRPGVKYFCKIYADQDGKRIYNDELPYEFETKSPEARPTISVSDIKLQGGSMKMVIQAKMMDGFTIGAQMSMTNDFTEYESHILVASDEMLDGYWWQKSNLLPSTTFYYRTFITSNSETEYGNVGNFTTDNLPYDVDATAESTSISLKGKFSGNVSIWGISTYKKEGTVSYGVICSTKSTFDASTSGILDYPMSWTINTDTFSYDFDTISWTNLSSATQYYYRAYYKVAGKYVYGEIKSVTTK